ncbi:hypothetical protein SAMD00019534_106580 [Acytostelium subglobosum LB1]|uniref:hypothetical protein n=1 Tax=Acytostelium subglobosum LB1 TaxID=1410327 RepID=UPI000644F133|nr:hypothetical protein SAMD00019534_106580 [Acytostelium subglobosum LB1]GAM27482.1 hypothetical protein SAMD00019534_106580 [Acytostelium subglobosum LB1]|eukprot:XP_012749547.1 hypothetical protein SAMD00019534_106580 [Acytostelium subglobosum LB1]
MDIGLDPPNAQNDNNDRHIRLRELFGLEFRNASSLTFESYVISYNGVLTMAFKSWTPSLSRLKRTINQSAESLAMANHGENMGTKWPKITLACLKDNLHLSRSQFEELHVLCRQITNSHLSNNHVRSSPDSAENTSIVDSDHDEDNVQFVRTVINETLHSTTSSSSSGVIDELVVNNRTDYYSKVTNHSQGNANHSNHYLEQLTSDKFESTLVHFVCQSHDGDVDKQHQQQQQQQEQLMRNRHISSMIEHLRETIESNPNLTGIYDWMPLHSVHISVRAIKYASTD